MLPIEIGLHSTEKVTDLKGVDVYASLKKIRLQGSFTILYYYYLYYMFKLARSREWVMSYRSYLLSSSWPKLDLSRETWLEEFDGHISENLAMERCQVSQQSLLHAAAQEGLHVLCQELLSAAKLRGRRKASSKLQKFNFVSRRIPGSSLFL